MKKVFAILCLLIFYSFAGINAQQIKSPLESSFQMYQEMKSDPKYKLAPSDPNIMYASLWEVYPGISGKNSGMYRSTDGGKKWMACDKGLPSGPMTGRIGLTVSYTNPLKAYAMVDNLHNNPGTSAELYKTIGGGITWNKTHKDSLRFFSVVGWYFTDVYVNPNTLHSMKNG